MKKIIKNILNSIGIDIKLYRKAIRPLDFLKSYNINTVFDVGANVGQFAEEIREYLPNAKIYSFEPVKSVYEKLLDNRKSDNLWEGFNSALGETKGSAEINVSPYSPSSSLLPKTELLNEAFPHTKGTTKELTQVYTIDSIANTINCSSEILIKLDVQGFEDKVIKGGHNIFSKAKIVLIETSFFQIYEGQPLFDDIYKLLTNLGFKYHGSFNIKRHPHTYEILFEDSIFIRK